MAITLQNNKITFPNATTQNSVGLTAAGGTVDGITSLNGLTFGNVAAGFYTGGKTIQHYYWTGSMPSNTTTWLLANTNSYSDIHFFATATSNSGGYYFRSWSGTFGGYGGQFGSRGNLNGTFSLSWAEISPGYGKIGLTMGTQGTAPGAVSFQCIMYGGEAVSALTGTLNP